MRIIIVDEHALVRRGMACVVCGCFEDAEIVETSGMEDSLRVMEAAPVDVALIDVRMPDASGLELLKAMQARWPKVPVILLTTFDAQHARRALAEGAAGYLLEDATPTDLEQAIRVAVSGGGNVLSPRVIRNLFAAAEPPNGERIEMRRHPEGLLTRREIGILALLAEGRSNRDISQTLFVSEKTVKAHLASIFRKLGLSNRTQAAMVAVAMGIGGSPLTKQYVDGRGRQQATVTNERS
jgi:two-component system response regulator DegU